jgi:dihydroneopterin aldolase
MYFSALHLLESDEEHRKNSSAYKYDNVIKRMNRFIENIQVHIIERLAIL